MNELISGGWILFISLLAIVLLKLFIPKISYILKLPLMIAIVDLIYFGWEFVYLVDTNFNLWPLIFCGLCCVYIYNGGKNVSYKTITGVFSKITRKPVGVMKAGSLNWACPIFETVSSNIDGIPNKALDLQELEIKMSETPIRQTSTRGIQAKVKNINFMLKLKEDFIEELLEIEGGGETIKERIVEFIDEFFLKKISQKSPEDLDQDKSNIIEELCNELEIEVNDFCDKNKYPYKIVDSVIIGDTELEAKYYEVLAKNQFAKLEQEAKDTEAKKLSERLIETGKKLLPSGSEKEQAEASLIALGIVKKDISEKKYNIDSDLANLAKDIALYFKK